MIKFTFNPKEYPPRPGCYQFFDRNQNILYVGKSKNLRKRLGSYFYKNEHSPRLKELTSQISDIEVILVNNESESLLLENTLIDHYRPPYNLMQWRADIGFPFIVQTDEPFPRFLPFFRKRPNTPLGDTPIRKYYGPYLNSNFRNEVLDFINNQYKLRTCNSLPDEACLRYQIERCSAPCENRISEEDYFDTVRKADNFLAQNRHTEILTVMKNRMEYLANQLAFEQAEKLRLQIKTLEKALEKQAVDRFVPYDQFMLFFEGNYCLVTEFSRGCLLKMDFHHLQKNGSSEPIEKFLLELLTNTSPPEIITNLPYSFLDVAKQLHKIHGYEITFRPPQSEIELDQLRLCKMNFEYRLMKHR
ncbi:MAG: GIY-YIG nuclease family protein [Aliifodinibius sp.]|nr:GIY-YIG nuclease family protein [Fodinibius sp.]NIW44260.1 GIY-YIG nuclease family protein [Gammaproteobacteria bacterium]NIY24676.1 GIY-YIG nuclease family protein [Fodinibius sp.]